MNIDELIEVSPQLLETGVCNLDGVTDAYKAYAELHGHKPVRQLHRMMHCQLIDETGEVLCEMKGLLEVCKGVVSMNNKYKFMNSTYPAPHVSADDLRQLKQNYEIWTAYCNQFHKQLGMHGVEITTTVTELKGTVNWCLEDHAQVALSIKGLLDRIKQPRKEEIK